MSFNDCVRPVLDPRERESGHGKGDRDKRYRVGSEDPEYTGHTKTLRLKDESQGD